jgi:hypothetical protein
MFWIGAGRSSDRWTRTLQPILRFSFRCCMVSVLRNGIPISPLRGTS